MAIACADARERHLYRVAQLRAIEAAAAAALPPNTLMQRAGAATAAQALRMLGSVGSDEPVLVLAGPGNNGGDALEAAALLAGQGRAVSILLLADPARLPPDAQAAYRRAQGSAARFIDALPPTHRWSLVIDGLFGIGLARALDAPFSDVIQAVNQTNSPVLAIDVPSGLDADSGQKVRGGWAIRASATVSFIGNKPGLHTLHGRDCAGEVSVASLDIDASLFPTPFACLNHPDLFAGALRPRPHASHKGSFGDLSVIGGAPGMAGAVILAARMAAMAGAGRVYAAFVGPAPAFDPLHPELMCRDAATLGLDTGAAVVGPGLGRTRAAADQVALALACRLPLVIDADALNLIAAEPGLQSRLAQRRAPTVMTPHPLEAARLLATDVGTVQADRLQAAQTLAARFRSIMVLKGSGSVIAAPEGRCVVNPTGNMLLATAGSGDVLAGLCGALLTQQMPAWEAALAAVWLHGAAADQLQADGEGPAGVTAAELLPAIRAVFNRQLQRH